MNRFHDQRRSSPYHSHFDSAMGVLLVLAFLAVLLALVQ